MILDLQLGGFAADPPTGSMGGSDASTSQLVQAMVSVAAARPRACCRHVAAAVADNTAACMRYGAAENKFLEIKSAPPSPGAALLGQHACGVLSFHLRTSHGRGV